MEAFEVENGESKHLVVVQMGLFALAPLLLYCVSFHSRLIHSTSALCYYGFYFQRSL